MFIQSKFKKTKCSIQYGGKCKASYFFFCALSIIRFVDRHVRRKTYIGLLLLHRLDTMQDRVDFLIFEQTRHASNDQLPYRLFMKPFII